MTNTKTIDILIAECETLKKMAVDFIIRTNSKIPVMSDQNSISFTETIHRGELIGIMQPFNDTMSSFDAMMKIDNADEFNHNINLLISKIKQRRFDMRIHEQVETINDTYTRSIIAGDHIGFLLGLDQGFISILNILERISSNESIL